MRNGRSHWPQWMYHPVFDAKKVTDQKHADAVAPEEDGWRDSPYSDEEKAAWKQPKNMKNRPEPEQETEEETDPRPVEPRRGDFSSSNAFNKAKIKYDKDLAAWRERNEEEE